MLCHPLNNFKIQRYYQNEPKVNGIYSGNNLLITKMFSPQTKRWSIYIY